MITNDLTKVTPTAIDNMVKTLQALKTQGMPEKLWGNISSVTLQFDTKTEEVFLVSAYGAAALDEKGQLQRTLMRKEE